MAKPTITRGKQKPRFALKKANLFFASAKSHLELVSSGCELLNCVLGGGYPLGRMVNIVGDKSTGKTLLAIEAMANFRRQFKDGVTSYCETEAAFDDPYAEALGLDLKGILRPDVSTVEELFDDLTKFIADLAGRPGLYIVDSLDALSDKAEQERGIADSTYGASKPKQLGQLFRRLVKPLEKSRVLIIIISQVRDAIGVTFGKKHTRSGGKALDFYASQILWLAHKGRLKRTVKKVQRATGVSVKAMTEKNKIGQPFRECEFEILFGYGVDDVSSGLEFLKEAGRLEELGIGSTDQAIAQFKKTYAAGTGADRTEMRQELNAAVRKAWYEIEANFTPPRGKYTADEE